MDIEIEIRELKMVYPKQFVFTGSNIKYLKSQFTLCCIFYLLVEKY